MLPLAAIDFRTPLRPHRWSRFGLPGVLLCLLSACASGTPEPEQPGSVLSEEEPSEEGELSDGRQCLKDAAMPREPNPTTPSRISVRHILVRHSELADPRGATRSPEAACLRALQALRALEGGAGWSATVAEYNDAADDALGRVAREDLTPAFADAAFSLEVDQLSYVVETDRGFHVILREK